jgi:hypothetical protein
MERKTVSEVELAWVLWQRLQELSDLLWNRYDKDFLILPMENDYDLTDTEIP